MAPQEKSRTEPVEIKMAKSRIGRVLEATGGVFLITACVIFRPLMRRWYSRWGATDEELVRKLPGDEYISCLRAGYTQAVGIKAAADSVWPWVVQIGQGRAGYYSYELLENMVGCNIHNVERVMPEHQDIKVGDGLIMHPKAPVVPVAIVKPVEALVYGGKQDENTSNVWTFHLCQEQGTTRLISRWSADFKPVFLNNVIYKFLVEPIGAVMQRKMLLEIKRLAETVSG